MFAWSRASGFRVNRSLTPALTRIAYPSASVVRVKDGIASHTARSVAARRLGFERATAEYGDPDADLALARDVAAGLVPAHSRMGDYIRARTAFFDRVVVAALNAGTSQVVVGAAGYDGRSLRYARPGVRWFEVDHPATQADKMERLARLGIDAGHVRFVAADFTKDPVAGRLLEAGLDTSRPALFLFEGIAVYLEDSVTESVLTQFRRVTMEGSLLAISLSMKAKADAQGTSAFRERVAALGEPARSTLDAEGAVALLARAGWQIGTENDPKRTRQTRHLSAGLLTAHAAGSAPRRRAASPPAAARKPAARKPAAREAGAGGASPDGGDLPLPALLSRALVAFTIEADNEAEHRFPHRTTNGGRSREAAAAGPWLTSLLMWANCLRQLPDDGITVAELRRRARTGTNLDGMRRWRYVTYTPDPGRDKRPRADAIVAPTAAGRRARAVWPAVTKEVEARWRTRFGPVAIDRLRAALVGIVARLDPALPDCLPILGHGLRCEVPDGYLAASGHAFDSEGGAGSDSADTAVGGTEPAADAEPAAHAEAAALPLWALLSKALLAFALQYERGPGPSLAVSANVLRVLSSDGVRTRDVPALAGISKEAVAMAVGLLAKTGLAAEGADPGGSRYKITRLTGAGVAARDAYPARTADVEADWRTCFGAGRVDALRAALEPLAAGDPPPLFAALEPYPDNWRARVKPPALLPHYPMTLHRGGYPDGA